MTLLLGAVGLGAVHVVVGLAWPFLTQLGVEGDAAGGQLRPALNLAWYSADVCLLVVGVLGPRRRLVHWFWIGAGYAVMMWLLWPLMRVLAENVLLLVLSIVMYAGMLHRPRLLGYLFLFLICQRFTPAYLYAAFLLTSLLYTTLGPFVDAWRKQGEWFVPLCHVVGLILLTGLLLPIIYFCTQSSPQDIHQRLGEAEVLSALGMSLRTSATATLIVLLLGVPMAYAMVRRSFPGKALLDTLIDLPIVVPPPIAGVALLAFFGAKAPLGEFLSRHAPNLQFYDSVLGLVVAQVFVGSPYLIRASMVAFGAVDERYEHVARTLGASRFSAFVRVTLPMSLRGILIGVILTWFRAMAEFGAIRIMANRPITIPILTFERFIEYDQTESQSVAVLILMLCMGVIAGMWILRTMPNMLGRSIGASDADD